MSDNLHTKITDLVKTLTDDYGKGRTIDEIKMFEYPDKEVVIDILEKLKIVIYPGYYRNSNYRTYTVRNNVAILIEDIIYNLIKQTSVVLRYSPEFADSGEDEIAAASERITFEFLGKLPKIREYIETDIQAAYDGDPAAYNKDEIICTYPGLYAILTARIAHELFVLGVPLIPRILFPLKMLPETQSDTFVRETDPPEVYPAGMVYVPAFVPIVPPVAPLFAMFPVMDPVET